MKNLVATLITLFTVMTYAQDQKQNPIPQINVAGEGKIKVTPDQVIITLGVENTGKDATEVKKANDAIIDKVIKFIKQSNIPQSDYQTTNVSLNKNYDYEKKKYNYVASQTISVTLKDIKKYDEFMMGITDTGITNINGVEFKSSKIEQYQTEARKKAMLDAKQKALDYTSVLNQKVGKAILISDNSQTYYPQPVYRAAMMKSDSAAAEVKETLAIGEIEVTANVQVAFILD
ncbi:SIMPL domain-containing protein [Flavobacterium sp.]|uniref:SIMPL domain-containing protein n=1 Tax=Flavobacterium sp. TaxID=239 RepID=UPI0026395F39|nr:SIMPL domain-containing protein [Flavobacterium sp.]